MYILCFFFFSSRRRHTRWTGDWSSDVCSSDLQAFYHDYAVYLAIVAGEHVEEGLAHFRAKVENNDLTKIGTFPAAVLVNLYVRLNRLPEALAVARRYLSGTEGPPPACPSIAELCKETKDFQTLAAVAREQGDPVHFIAGLLAAKDIP